MESLVLLCLEEKTDARIEYASDEEKRHIIYPSFLLIHIEESTIHQKDRLEVGGKRLEEG